MFDIFKRKSKQPEVIKPSVMGLGIGGSFEIDTLAIKLVLSELTIAEVTKTQIIQAAGQVELDGIIYCVFIPTTMLGYK